MNSFKFFWNTHKWVGIALSAVFVVIATTGFLLLIKKRVDWIQPPTMVGIAGEVDQFISMAELARIVETQGHADFASWDDVDRIDVRPGKRIYKVRSKHHHTEIQVDAVSGAVLGVASRPSDLIETIHDGSFFADWVHDWFMPVVPFALLFMVFSGFWLWLEPKVRRRQRQRQKRRQG